jgi:hypothetical protein
MKKLIKTFEQFIFEAEAVKAEDSDVYIDDVTANGGDLTIKGVEILGAIKASATEKEFKDYFFQQYGQTTLLPEDMATLCKYYNEYKEEENKEKADSEKEGDDETSTEEDPLAGLDTDLPTGEDGK